MTRTSLSSLLLLALIACGDGSESDGEDPAAGSPQAAGKGGSSQAGAGASGSAAGSSAGAGASGGSSAGSGTAGAALAGQAGAGQGGSGQGGAGQGGSAQGGAGQGGAGQGGSAQAGGGPGGSAQGGAGSGGVGGAAGAGQAGAGGVCSAPVPCPKLEPVDGEPCDPCTAEVCGYDRCDKPTPSNSAAECLPSGFWKVSPQSCAVVKCGTTSCPAGLVCLKYDVAGPGTESGCAKDPCFPEPLGCGCAGPIFCKGLQCIEGGQSTIVCSDKEPN